MANEHKILRNFIFALAKTTTSTSKLRFCKNNDGLIFLLKESKLEAYFMPIQKISSISFKF